MKALILILTACATVALSGCATNQGGDYDQNTTMSATVRGNPASPTFRPGMNPNDIRDPNSLRRPIEQPPSTPP
jgi:hypothetical protein